MANKVFEIKGNLDEAKTHAREAFGDLGFKVDFTSSRTGFAERGSRAMSALAGPLSGKKGAYCKIEMSLSENGETTGLTLSEDTGGLLKVTTLGVAKKAFKEAVDNVEKALLRAGALV